MLGYLFAFLYTKIVARLHAKYEFKKETLEKLKKYRHHGTVVSEGFEFQLFLTYIFPLTHGAVATFATHTGLTFLLRLYGG